MADGAEAPAKLQKKQHGDTPHRAREGFKKQAQKKQRPQANKGSQNNAFAARRDIDACSQRGDVEGALAIFQRVKGQDISLQVHSYNVLLHLCSGGNQAEDATTRIFAEQAAEVFEHMRAKGVAAVEMTYTALARVAAGGGNGARAYELIAEMRASGVQPKLRTFTPALQCFCEAGDIAHAIAIETDIRTSGISLSELEYALLVAAMTGVAAAETEAWALLRRMKEDLRLVSADLLQAIRAWFAALGPEWQVDSTTVSDEGVNAHDASIHLQPIDLTETERVELASAIAVMSRARERAQDFDGFVEWSERHGPFDTIIDGANVGMFNQNFQDAKFNFNQVEKLMAHLRSERSEDAKPVLLVLHQRRVRGGPANAPFAVKMVKNWRANNELFTTPAGSNDDWYWLYAAVLAGPTGRLVTNDELRDHVFQMLPAPRLFYKWKERHQVRFQFTAGGVVLNHPSAFTTCIQEAADSSWWMFPSAESDDWLCAKRISEAAPAAL